MVRSAPLSQCLSSLLSRAATPEDLEAIRLTCLDKEIELELILEKWQVSRLKERDATAPNRCGSGFRATNLSLPNRPGLGWPGWSYSRPWAGRWGCRIARI